MFLTLTVKNCRGEDLKSTIQMLLKGFDRMFRRAVFKKYVLGFIRSLEVTYNEQTRVPSALARIDFDEERLLVFQKRGR